MGKSKPPSPKPTPAPPDPNANEEMKANAGLAATNAKRRSLAAQSEGSFGQSAGALGAAPTQAPGLKSTLG